MTWGQFKNAVDRLVQEKFNLDADKVVIDYVDFGPIEDAAELKIEIRKDGTLRISDI